MPPGLVRQGADSYQSVGLVYPKSYPGIYWLAVAPTRQPFRFLALMASILPSRPRVPKFGETPLRLQTMLRLNMSFDLGFKFTPQCKFGVANHVAAEHEFRPQPNLSRGINLVELLPRARG